MERETGNNLKIGLFGGTFNPIHLGHLRPVEEIRQEFCLSKIFFIPAHIPPHKGVQAVSSRHRFAMVKESISGNPFFDISDIETTRQGNSYSFETINYFTRLYTNKAVLFFIMGVDAFREIHAWRNYPDFFSSCNFIIMSRPGREYTAGTPEGLIPTDIKETFRFNAEKSCFSHESGCHVYLSTVTPFDISSSGIRSNLEREQSIKYLVPEAVETYINRYKLYKRTER